MSPKLYLADSIVGSADPQPLGFRCWWADGGPDAAWVHLAGELDIATTPHLERALRVEPSLQARVVVLDLRDLEFMDSSAVHAIVDASARAQQVGRRLLLLGGSFDADRVFTLTASSDNAVAGDIHRVEPSAEALMKVVEQGLVS